MILLKRLFVLIIKYAPSNGVMNDTKLVSFVATNDANEPRCRATDKTFLVKESGQGQSWWRLK